MICEINEEHAKLNTKDIFPNARDIIKYSFTIDGIPYFEFDDFNNIPSARGFKCLTFYNELSMRCTREFLIAHTTAVDNIINNPKGIKLTEIIKMNMQLKERLEWISELDVAYKLCSVVFFDATENPYRYEYKHSLEKAQKFKDAPLDEFFFLSRITKLLPSMTLSAPDLKTYLETMTAINQEHLGSISMTLSETQKNTDWYKVLMSLNPELSVLTK
jgi:hypothetical protein